MIVSYLVGACNGQIRRLLALEDAVDVAGGAPENKVVELDIVDRASDSTIGRTRQRAGWLVRGGTEI